MVNKRDIVVSTHVDAECADIAYWRSQSPEARLQHQLELRIMNYGIDQVSEEFRRILEIVPLRRGQINS
jgi:hypothetical protein